MTYSRPANMAHVVWQLPGSPMPTVYLTSLPDGPASVLDGTAALIWLSAVSAGQDVTSVLDQVAESVGEEQSTIEGEVTSFLHELCQRELLMEDGLPSA